MCGNSLSFRDSLRKIFINVLPNFAMVSLVFPRDVNHKTVEKQSRRARVNDADLSISLMSSSHDTRCNAPAKANKRMNVHKFNLI